MTKKVRSYKTVGFIAILLVVLGLASLLWYRNWKTKFDAPKENTQPIEFTIKKDLTLTAVVGDLHYYGFIKDEDAFKYALEHSKDNTPGNENSLKIGNNTIDREARYTISQSMTAWQIADVLLNQGEFSTCDHGCPDSNFDPVPDWEVVLPLPNQVLDQNKRKQNPLLKLVKQYRTATLPLLLLM